jgi:hypothetical protein
MAYFQTKNHNLGKFWRDLQWKMLVYFMIILSIVGTAIRYTLWPFGIFCGHLVILWSFGTFSPFLVRCNKKNLVTLFSSYF